MKSARALEVHLREIGDPDHARFVLGYFKAGPGGYAERDRFLGIRTPALRQLARAHEELPLEECRALLRSPYHEARMLALLVLVRKCERGDDALRERIYRLYLAEVGHVNNWDLVDASAPQIVGRHLHGRSRRELTRLARSKSIWERRIAIVATFHYIKRGELEETLRVADLLLADPHDLIHKATGWMLREVGKRDRAVLEGFLKTRYHEMPRTMLRYAIERFPEELRRRYLRGEV